MQKINKTVLLSALCCGFMFNLRSAQLKSFKKLGELVQEQVVISKDEEQILVVPREAILPEGSFYGLQERDYAQLCEIVDQHKQFLRRGNMETDPNFKQIIPYLIFKFEDQYFLMQRSGKASEARLKNLYSLGIGGHIRAEDMANKDDILSWAEREFAEEVNYAGEFETKFLGLLNDDTNAVGEVHIGAVFLLVGDSDQINIKDEHQNGSLKTLAEIAELKDQLESWSRIVVEFLSIDR